MTLSNGPTGGGRKWSQKMNTVSRYATSRGLMAKRGGYVRPDTSGKEHVAAVHDTHMYIIHPDSVSVAVA